MTREHAQALLPIITAYAEGKTIQHNDNAGSGHPPDWKDMTDPQFRGDTANLRIKPEPDPYAELKAAHEAGKVIQCFCIDGKRWFDCKPSWNASPNKYRIKPTPKLVPMTSDDLPPVVWIKQLASSHMEMVTVITEEGTLETAALSSTIEFLERTRFQWSTDRKNWNSFMKEVEG